MEPADFFRRHQILAGDLPARNLIRWISTKSGENTATLNNWRTKKHPLPARAEKTLELLEENQRLRNVEDGPRQIRDAHQLARWALAMREVVRKDASVYVNHLDAYLASLPISLEDVRVPPGNYR